MVTDSRAVQEVLVGDAVLEEEAARTGLEEATSQAVKLLRSGWITPTAGEPPWVWRPRGLNKVADLMCNRVMDCSANLLGYYPHDGLDNSHVHKYFRSHFCFMW